MKAVMPGKKTYCVDIDGVIAEQDSLCKTCKYEASSPIRENIEIINKFAVEHLVL